MVESFSVVAIGLALLVVAILAERHVIVLAFHSTSVNESDSFTLRPRKIHFFVNLLQLLGYGLATQEQLTCFSKTKVFPRRSVLLTFDDGYSNNFHFLVWLLKRGVPIAVFVSTGHIGGKNIWDDGDKKILSSDRLSRLMDLGAVICSHAHDHQHLTQLSPEELETTLNRSRSALNEYGSAGADCLAYPYGSYNDKVIQRARKEGFVLGFSTIPRSIHETALKVDSFQLGRLSMRREWGVGRFLLEILLMRLRGWKWSMKNAMQ